MKQNERTQKRLPAPHSPHSPSSVVISLSLRCHIFGGRASTKTSLIAYVCKNKLFDSNLRLILDWFDSIFLSPFLLAEPSTEIIGAPDLYIESGSTINLTCVVHNSPEPPAFIFWNHNNAVSVQHIALLKAGERRSAILPANVNEKFKERNSTSKIVLAPEHAMAYLAIIIHFVSFMSHWKHLSKMDSLLAAFFGFLAVVEILWPPCPVHRVASTALGESSSGLHNKSRIKNSTEMPRGKLCRMKFARAKNSQFRKDFSRNSSSTRKED